MRLEVVMAATLLLIAVYKYSPLPVSDALIPWHNKSMLKELFLTFDNALHYCIHCSATVCWDHFTWMTSSIRECRKNNMIAKNHASLWRNVKIEKIVQAQTWLIMPSLNYIKNNRLKDHFCLKPHISMEMPCTYEYDTLLARIGHWGGPYVFTFFI